MNKKIPRPGGVVIAFILLMVLGAFYFIIAGKNIIWLPLGIFCYILAINLWNGKNWARMLSVIPFFVAIMFGLLVFFAYGELKNPFLEFLIVSGPLFAMGIAIFMFYLLLSKRVRSFFTIRA